MRKWFLVVPGVVLIAAMGLLAVAPAAPEAAAPAPAPPPAPAPAAALQADLDRIFADAGLPKTLVGVRVIFLAGPASAKATADKPGGAAEVLYSARADQPMVPASTMKLVTTAACLDRFGPEWRIRTYVGRVPAAQGGDAKWDLAVIGGGDPNFSGRSFSGDSVGAFRLWAGALKARGIAALGRIILDDSLFDNVIQHPHWPAGQRAEWYEAPVSALSINDSCVDVRIAPGKPGEPAIVSVQPPGDYVRLEGAIMTTAQRKEHNFSIQRLGEGSPGGKMRLRLGGKYWAGAAEATEFRALIDPTMTFGAALAEALRAEGIAVAGPVTRDRLVDTGGRTRGDFECDIVHASRLDTTIAVANKRSQGFYAECLLKLLGAFARTPTPDTPLPPRQGTWPGGVAEAERWLQERGIPTAGCRMDDGSGLSKENRLTALAVTELLRVMYERHGETFVQTLAVAGQEGSLAKRMRGTPAEGRVFGKTGYVLGTSALSGYVRTRTGRMAIFSIIMNDVRGQTGKARDAQDKVCLRLVDL